MSRPEQDMPPETERTPDVHAASPWTRVAADKLERILGPQRAEPLMRATLAELGVRELESADDLWRFGERLLRHGGFVESLGRSLQIHAGLRGARGQR